MTCQPHWKPSSEHWKQRLQCDVSKGLLPSIAGSTHATRPPPHAVPSAGALRPTASAWLTPLQTMPQYHGLQGPSRKLETGTVTSLSVIPELQRWFPYVRLAVVCAQLRSRIRLFVTPWTVPTRLLCPWDSQARILVWVAIPFSRASSPPRDRTQISYILGGFFTLGGEDPLEKGMATYSSILVWRIPWTV